MLYPYALALHWPEENYLERSELLPLGLCFQEVQCYNEGVDPVRLHGSSGDMLPVYQSINYLLKSRIPINLSVLK